MQRFPTKDKMQMWSLPQSLVVKFDFIRNREINFRVTELYLSIFLPFSSCFNFNIILPCFSGRYLWHNFDPGTRTEFPFFRKSILLDTHKFSKMNNYFYIISNKKIRLDISIPNFWMKQPPHLPVSKLLPERGPEGIWIVHMS